MKIRTLITSHMIIGAFGIVIGYGLADTRDQQSVDTTVIQNESSDTARTDEALTQALDKVAVLQTKLSLVQTEEFPVNVAAESTIYLDEDPQTIDEKVATYRKLSQDQDVRRAMIEESRKVMETAEAKSSQRERSEIEARIYLEELTAKLGFDDERRDEFYAVYVDGQMAEMDALMAIQTEMLANGNDEEARRALQAEVEAVREQSRQKMAEYLGTDFEAYDTYARTMSQRAELNKIYASRQPLDDYTKEALLLIMDEEQTAIGEPEPYYGQDMSVVLELQKDVLQRLTARDERVLERATSYLDASQYEILDDNLKLRREQIKMSTRYLESQVEQQAQSEQAAAQD